MRNSFRSYCINDTQLNEIWSVIDSFDNNNSQQSSQKNTDQETNKRKLQEECHEDNSIYKKANLSSDARFNSEFNENIESEFDWFELIKTECVKNQDTNGVSLKKLQKKVPKFFIFVI